MKRSEPGKLIICLLMGFFLVSSRSLFAEEEYKGKLMTEGGPIRERVINIKIVVEDFSKPGDIQNMLKVLDGGDSEDFLRAFRNSKKGAFIVLGARGLNVRINVAHIEPTDEGRKLLLFMERQSWSANTTTVSLGKYRFMMVELELDIFGNGTGKFYPGITVQLTPKGMMVMDEFTTPYQILGVQKLK